MMTSGGPLRLPSLRWSFRAGRRLARRLSGQDGQDTYGRLRDPVLSRAGAAMNHHSGDRDDPIGQTAGGLDESTVLPGDGQTGGDFWFDDELVSTNCTKKYKDCIGMDEIEPTAWHQAHLTPFTDKGQPSSTSASSADASDSLPKLPGESTFVSDSELSTPASRGHMPPHRPVEFTLGGATLSSSISFTSSRRSPAVWHRSSRPPQQQQQQQQQDLCGTSGYPLFLSRDDLSSEQSDSSGSGADGSRGEGADRWRHQRPKFELSPGDGALEGEEAAAAAESDSGLGASSGDDTDGSGGEYTTGRSAPARRRSSSARRTERMSAAGCQKGDCGKQKPRIASSVRRVKGAMKKLLKVN